MKFATIVTLFASLASAAPAVDSIVKRQANEACTVGYCTQNGGTKGGAGGATVNVNSLAALEAALKRTEPLIIVISGNISGNSRVRVTSNKTILGKSGSSLTGIGFYVTGVKNVIIRNLKLAKVLAKNGDAIGIENSSNVWVDHCDISGDLSGKKDDLDGLLDLTRGSDWVTITNTYFHDHWKGSLVGNSDDLGATDKGKLHVTYANNYWKNVNSRQPFVRFGVAHIVNNYYDGIIVSGVNPRMGAQVLVQSTAFNNSAKRAIFSEGSKEPGYAVAEDVALGSSVNSALKGTLTSASLPYNKIPTLGSANVAKTIPTTAGQKLKI